MLDRVGGFPLREQAEGVSAGLERGIVAARELQKELFVLGQHVSELESQQLRCEDALAYRLAQRDKRLRGALRGVHLELSRQQAGLGEQLQDCAKDTEDMTKAANDLEQRLHRLQARVGVAL